ncbi:MAG: urease accessory protein UreE [Hyphomicrobiales bacterium]|nr:urease accessory protein UreE [Hyphomicrobiales bacterium]
MKTATRVLHYPDPRLEAVNWTITLPREERYRRRRVMTTDCGLSFLLDLDQATYLAGGDGLLLDNGAVVGVQAMPEPLLEITAADAATLARIAWHIGNRHTPAEITVAAIYIQPDHVLAAMVEGLGGSVGDVTRPFEPEGGAYGGHGSLEAGHHHGGDHRHHAAP